MSNPMTVLQYLKAELSMTGSEFMKAWKDMDKADKEDLKSAAKAEMAALGIPVKE